MTDRLPRAGAWQILRTPLALAAVSTAGLVTSLIGDGGWDLAGAGLLLAPAAIGLAKLMPDRARPMAAPLGFPVRVGLS